MPTKDVQVLHHILVCRDYVRFELIVFLIHYLITNFVIK